MMKQMNLDDVPPRSRTTDPDTSHKAEREMRQSGALGKQAQAVFDLVSARPGHTTWELANGDALMERRIGRRLADLEHKGLTRKGGSRTCAVGQRTCTIWFPS